MLHPCQPPDELGVSLPMRLFSLFLGLWLLFPAPVLAWSDHARLSWSLLRTQPKLKQTVFAEPLESFLIDQQAEISTTLANVERWALREMPHYSKTPDDLRWRVSETIDDQAFYSAIRVNPFLFYRLYIQELPNCGPKLGKRVNWSELSFLGGGPSRFGVRYWSLLPGEEVSIAEVVASASDEPDFGMDVGLFSDNGTEFGHRYGFGTQPFGNPNLEYGSQAPFHMGFYHLDWLTRLVEPNLLRTYPLWRIVLFGELAALAFKSEHPYWGWRFLGWGLHYIGDLAQPYHAVPLPGVSAIDAFLMVANGETKNGIQLVSNRHGVIESYHYQRMISMLSDQDWAASLLDISSSANWETPLDYSDVKSLLTSTSAAAAEEFDQLIADNFPAQFVNDPTYEWVGSGQEDKIIDLVIEMKGLEAIKKLDAALIDQLKLFSLVASRWIARGLMVDKNQNEESNSVENGLTR